MVVYIGKTQLSTLLKMTQRPQTIAGKSNSQVNACMLTVAWPRIYTCSLVRDGVSSVSIFSQPLSGHASPKEGETTIESSNGQIPIVNIEDTLGALNHHSEKLTLIHKEGSKLLVKSKSKQTTLTSNADALAFPHSPASLQEWYTKSVSIAGKVLSEGVYELNDGEKVTPFHSYFNVDVNTLHEALRCVNMNNQKLNEYTFVGSNHTTKDGLKVITGNQLKGQTEYTLDFPLGQDCKVRKGGNYQGFKATFGGGLDHIMRITRNSKADLHFVDLRDKGQGIKLIIELGEGDFLLQSSIGDCEVYV